MQNLNNPTGKALFEHDLIEISKVLDRYDVPVLVDEVYRDFSMNIIDGEMKNAFPSMIEVNEHSMITSSVTKVYGGGGLMAGWLLGPKRVINRARRLKIYTVPMVNHMGNHVALDILRRRNEIMPSELNELRRRSNLVSLWSKGRSDVHWSEPDGCAVGFLRYDHDIPSIKVCEGLYEKFGVRVIPGEFFHMEKGFRLALSRPYELIKGALSKIDRYFDSL
jgi:aspartate/methionine/tyrosine aminotransferase